MPRDTVNSTAALNKLEVTLSKIIGQERVSKQRSYLSVRPRTSDEISKILKFANRMKTPVSPRGGATGWWSSTRPRAGGILINMTKMNKVLVIDEDTMTATVEAGITFSEFESKIAEKGYRIAIFPESGRTATVGGHIETWGTSPYTSSVFEDQATQIVALKVVLPNGEVVQTGSSAITTAAGNFARRFFPSDITGLFIGAEGAFGIIVEATFKIYEWPESMVTRMVGFKDLGGATITLGKFQEAQRRRALSTIVEQRLMQKETLTSFVPRLKMRLPEASTIFLVIRGEGETVEVKRHIAEACQIGRDQGGIVIDDDCPEWWQGRFDAAVAALGKTRRIMLVTYVPFGRFLEASDLTENFGRKHGISIMLLGYPFGGPVMLAHAVIPVEQSTSEARGTALSLGRELMEALVDIGCVPHRVGTDFLPVVTKKLDPSYYQLVKSIKQLLDPNRIMNPGVVVPD